MTDSVMRVYLRISPDARPSSIDLGEVDRLLGMQSSVNLVHDNKDLSVYSFDVPDGTDNQVAKKVMDMLADQSSVDEVWDSYVSVKARPEEKAEMPVSSLKIDNF